MIALLEGEESRLEAGSTALGARASDRVLQNRRPPRGHGLSAVPGIPGHNAEAGKNDRSSSRKPRVRGNRRGSLSPHSVGFLSESRPYAAGYIDNLLPLGSGK